MACDIIVNAWNEPKNNRKLYGSRKLKMRNSNTTKVFRITAGIMGLMMLIIVLFSSLYIAAETDHDCCGEDCPICACILQCENTLRSIGDGKVTQLSFIVPVLLFLLIAGIFSVAIPQDTLVSRKVKLNN